MEKNNSDNSAVTSVKDFPRKDTELSVDDAELPTCQCKSPLVPIYPVRYGLTKEYIDKVNNDTKSTIDEVPEPKGMRPKQPHQLQQLRQGFVYIYAHTQHRDKYTDEKGKWMVFRHATNEKDSNSSSKSPKTDTKSHSLDSSFFLYKWGADGDEGNWEKKR